MYAPKTKEPATLEAMEFESAPEKPKATSQKIDELLPEYDLRELLKSAVRGKYVETYRVGTNLVRLDPNRSKSE